MLASPHFIFLPISGPWISLAFIFILLNLWRLFWVMRNALKLSWGMAFRSMYGMFSVGWVVALAGFQALIRSKTAFLRTPKTTSKVRLLNALFATQWEASIGLLCLALGIAVFALADLTPKSYFIGSLLLWQSSLYLISPIYGIFYKSCD